MTEVAIIGAGPYGLAVAAHLADRGVGTRVFGRPMAFWQAIAGAAPRRFLKSYCFGTDIATPVAMPFAEWSRDRGLESFEPCAIGDFARYGLDVQRRFVPSVTGEDVTHVGRREDGFVVRSESGAEVRARTVVVATGLSTFERVPVALAHLPPALMRHSNAIVDYGAYRDRRVAIVGGGQSALEAAALVHEAGGIAELFVRDAAVRWMTRIAGERSLYQRLRSPLSGLGSGPRAWLLTNLPGACRLVPDPVRARFVARHLPPEGAWWLRARVQDRVPIRYATEIVRASAAGQQVELALADRQGGGGTARVDAVIAATGFRPDVDRLSFLDEPVRRRIRRLNGSPRLDHDFQSSVPGLFFVGPSSAMSFGPLFRFVIGSRHAATRVTGRLAGGMRAAA